LEYHDSWLEASSGIQPQLELQSFVDGNFVEETVEEDWEIVLVVDLQTELRTELLLERRLLVENPPELKLLAFLKKQDVL
jgi:hypothetical protein